MVKLQSAKAGAATRSPSSAQGGIVRVDGAQVIKTDIQASNGVIHVIDAVILPKGL